MTETNKKGLEETIKEKVFPLLEETMERTWGITIPQIETDITDQLKKPQLHIYVPAHSSFGKAKKLFKAEFFKKELKLHLGNVSQLAKTLGLDRRSIHRAIKELEISVEEARTFPESKEEEQQQAIGETIRSTLEQYKELIQPHQMEKIYQEVPDLSRNIAKLLPHPDLTWKEAEKEFEKQFLFQALKENNRNISQTAEKIKIRPETLHRKVKKLGLR